MGVSSEFRKWKNKLQPNYSLHKEKTQKKPKSLTIKVMSTYSESKFCFTELFLMSQLQRPDPLEETCCASSACVLTARLENAINKMPVASQWLLHAGRAQGIKY